MASKLRPFPFPINIGTDICQISRIYTILNSPRRARFVNRILAPEELARHGSRLNWSESGVRGDDEVKGSELWKTAAFVAGRCV
jgi:holo-[acyl-carrier protein] synthase